MHQLHALLPALWCVHAYALVALGEVPMDKGDGNAVLPLRGVKTDVAQAAVDLVHRHLLLLIDGLLVALPANMGAEELLAIQQCHDGVIEFHERHVAAHARSPIVSA